MSVCPSVRPSVRMEQLCTNGVDFSGIRHLNTFWKFVENIKNFENRTFNEIMWGKYCRTERATDGNIARRMRIVLLTDWARGGIKGKREIVYMLLLGCLVSTASSQDVPQNRNYEFLTNQNHRLNIEYWISCSLIHNSILFKRKILYFKIFNYPP